MIRDLPGINAVKVGHLYLKPAGIYETITHCCRMVFWEAEDQSLPLGRTGSATLVRFQGKNYVVTTRHELGIQRGAVPSRELLDTVRISSGSRQLSNIPISTCIFETSNSDQEYHDILIFETTKINSADIPYFLPLQDFRLADRIKSFLVGYPSVVGVMEDYIESFFRDAVGEIHIKRTIADCDFDLSFSSNAEYFKRYLRTKEKLHVDGFSGGAIFSLVGHLETDDLEIVLDGIVVRAGPQHIYIVDTDYLVVALNGGSHAHG